MSFRKDGGTMLSKKKINMICHCRFNQIIAKGNSLNRKYDRINPAISVGKNNGKSKP